MGVWCACACCAELPSTDLVLGVLAALLGMVEALLT